MSLDLGRAQPRADLVPALRSLRELGRFDEAAELVRAARMAPMSAQLHAAAGAALSAVSEYDAAAVHLLLAATDPGIAPQALQGLAELAWIEQDYARGRAFALEGLAIDPSHHGCRIQLYRNEAGLARAGRTVDPRGKLTHAAFFADQQGNAGDLVLADAVRRCFRPDPGVDHWHEVHVHQLFDDRRLAEVNASDALIVGGGGLFLPDTAPNGNSGWQWNVPDDVLRRIDVPLVVFAVGYNMFEGQQFSAAGGSRFRQSLRALVERATFIGLSNHGSVNRVRELLPDDLADRVRWQPCPTTITSLITPARTAAPLTTAPPGEPTEDATAAIATAAIATAAIASGAIATGAIATGAIATGGTASGAILLNCAYDRAGHRFGDGYGRFLTELREWIVTTSKRAPVYYVAHCVDDEKFVVDLRREHGITLPVIAMYNLSVAAIHETYRRAQLVVGMRGLAGMIPFGCRTPIISLISHPKLGYFLADIERPDWGLSIRDPRLGARLGELTTELLDSHQDVVADIGRIQQRLYDITVANVVGSLPAVMHHGAGVGQDAESE